MHGETVFVRSLILEHPQARSLTAQPSFVTPSMIQLSEQGGSLSTRLVTFGAEAADTVRAAAKRRMKSWKRDAILGFGWLSIVEKQHMEKESFDNQKERELSLREKMSTIMDSQSYYNYDGWKTPRPIHVPYSTNQRLSLLAFSPILPACTQCPRCAMSPHPNTNKGARTRYSC